MYAFEHRRDRLPRCDSPGNGREAPEARNTSPIAYSNWLGRECRVPSARDERLPRYRLKRHRGAAVGLIDMKRFRHRGRRTPPRWWCVWRGVTLLARPSASAQGCPRPTSWGCHPMTRSNCRGEMCFATLSMLLARRQTVVPACTRTSRGRAVRARRPPGPRPHQQQRPRHRHPAAIGEPLHRARAGSRSPAMSSSASRGRRRHRRQPCCRRPCHYQRPLPAAIERTAPHAQGARLAGAHLATSSPEYDTMDQKRGPSRNIAAGRCGRGRRRRVHRAANIVLVQKPVAWNLVSQKSKIQGHAISGKRPRRAWSTDTSEGRPTRRKFCTL